MPVETVVWVVLGIALFRDRSIEEVVSKLDLALPGGEQAGRDATQSGYPMARLVTHMVLRSHLHAGAHLGPYRGTHELEHAKEHVLRSLPIR